MRRLLTSVAGPGAILGLGATLAGTGVAAQPEPARAELRAFRDSVTVAADTTRLRGLESSLMLEARRDRTNAMLHLRLGVIAERFGAWRDAAAEYKWATDLEPRWPEAWLAWGLAELVFGDEVETAATNRRLRLARHAADRATRAVARAVELEPGFAERVRREVERVVAAGRRDWGAILRDGLARPASQRGAPGELHLALGRAERALGDSARSVIAFAAAAASPGLRGIGLLERARTQLTAGDERGIEAYYGGASADDSAGVRGYRADLALVASDDELARFDRAAPGERPALLWDLWTGRDRTDLRRNGERLMEHYRRIAAARALYGGLADLRARVLVRHGEPDGRASIRHASLPPNESWWYRRAGQPLVVHFVARTDTTKYEILESLFELGELDGGARARGSGESATAAPIDPELLLRSRAQLAPFYQAAVDAGAAASPAFRQQERQLAAAGQAAALATDAHPIRFARDLAARIQVTGLSEGGPGPALLLAVAVPGFAADAAGGPGIALYPSRLRTVVTDTLDQVVRAIDTVVVVEREAPAGPGERIGAELRIPLPPDAYRLRGAVQFGDAGTFVERRVVRVPDAATAELTLSDLLLAGRTPPVALRLADEAVPVDPAPVAGRADTLAVRSEVLGARGERGRLRVLLRARRPEGAPADRWRPFPGFSEWVALELPAGGRRALSLGLPLRRLGAGAYELQVVVVDGSGATAWQQAGFEVADRS